jgi:hypothetical protein
MAAIPVLVTEGTAMTATEGESAWWEFDRRVAMFCALQAAQAATRFARLADERHRDAMLNLAILRDHSLTPLEAAYAEAALDECLDRSRKEQQ